MKVNIKRSFTPSNTQISLENYMECARFLEKDSTLDFNRLRKSFITTIMSPLSILFIGVIGSNNLPCIIIHRSRKIRE